MQKQGDGAGRFLGVFCSDLLYQLRFCGVVEGAWCVVQGPRRVLILLPAVSVAHCLIPWGHDVTICKMGWLGRLEKLHSVEVKGFGSECLSLNLRPPLTSSTTLGKLLSLSDPESSHFLSGDGNTASLINEDSCKTQETMSGVKCTFRGSEYRCYRRC